MKLIWKAKIVKTKLFDKFSRRFDRFSRRIESFIKGIPIDGKYQNFIFINIDRLSQKEKGFLEKYGLEKKEFKHITKYKIKGLTKEIIITKLAREELYKLGDVMLSEFFEGKPFFKDYTKLMTEFLKAVHPQKERWRRYMESLLDFYINNYENLKNKEVPLLQSMLDGYKYIIDRIKGGSILDIGSDLGFLPILAKLKKPGLEVTASDMHYECFDVARIYCDRHNLKINFIKLDIRNPNIQKKYDTTFSSHLLEHFQEEENIKIIKNHIALANKKTILVMPFEKFTTMVAHKQILNEEKLEKIAKTLDFPYKIEKVSRWNCGQIGSLIIDIDT